MRIVKLNPTQMHMLDRAIDKANEGYEEFRLAYDETDQSIKYKVGNYGWSPPMKTEEI